MVAEQFAIGQVFEHEVRKTVLEAENMMFSTMTCNPAQLHIDHAYAATTEFGKPLVNSLLISPASSSGSPCRTPRSALQSPIWA